jgi:hypothetical protein
MDRGGHPVKRIEMNVASCGECPFLEDTSEYCSTHCIGLTNRCDHPDIEGCRDVYDTAIGEVLPNCPLPDAEPDPVSARLESLENAVRGLTARLPPPSVRPWWKPR